MANVLEKIVADKRQEIAEREQTFPLEQFKDGLVASQKSLFTNLNKNKVGFIFECKKASPSKGLIREHFDLDEILNAYLPYASGISVLTDEKYFQGRYEYLEYVTQRSHVPVLNKDFFVSEYQVYLARYYGADAILLMLSVLNDEEYHTLATLAESLALDVLTEVSNEEEMQRAIALEAKIIGINNRNLRDLSTDLATTERLVPVLEKARHDYVVISESGIYTHEDVMRLSAVSNGFLVGSALMAQTNLLSAVQGLVFGQTKVCGITRVEDALQAIQAGAYYLGLIFVDKSKRCVSFEQAREIIMAASADNFESAFENFVGVFQNDAIEKVAEYAASLNLAAVQLHGSETADFREDLRQQLPERIEIWQAVSLSVTPTQAELELARQTLSDNNCDKVLFDCKMGQRVGGTGQSFDWQCLSSLPNREKWVLAGGIGEHNISEASALSPSIIDINSKVEITPGVKDAQAIRSALNLRWCEALQA